MLDEKDLQAIAALMDARISASETRMEQKLKETEGRMIAMMEAHFDPKFGTLVDGHALILEQMVKKEDLTELLEDIYIQEDILDTLTRKNTRDIKKLQQDVKDLKKVQ